MADGRNYGPNDRRKVATLDLFLLLTAMLCGLTGIAGPADTRAPAVEASRIVRVAHVVAPAIVRVAVPRPDGYVAPAPLMLDPDFADGALPRSAPERRRE